MPKARAAIVWPENRRFAFTIIDDTDGATLERVKPFYDALQRLGLRTTKTVWSLPSPTSDPFWGESLEDPAYRAWLHELEASGFEIAWHGARSGGSKRAVVESGLQRFRDTFGTWPRTYANHARNRECIYWGADRFDIAALRRIYCLMSGAQKEFKGSSPGDAHYWSDLCAERIQYVRGFTFPSIVTSEADPWSPFYDARRPEVRAWFSAADAPDKDAFLRLLQVKNLDRLERSGGACILYTHVASRFVTSGKLDVDVERVLEQLASRPGWFVPVETILRHLEAARGICGITPAQRRTLETRFVAAKIGQKVLRRLGVAS